MPSGHWTVEALHNLLDSAFDEDRCRIRTGHGPVITTRLRRFAVGVIRAHPGECVAAAMRRLQRNPAPRLRLLAHDPQLPRNSAGRFIRR